MPSFNFRFYMHIWTVSSNLSNTSLSLFQSFSHLHHILPFSARLFEPLPQGRPGLLWVAPLSAVGHLNAVTYIRSNEGKPSSMNSHRIDCESSSKVFTVCFWTFAIFAGSTRSILGIWSFHLPETPPAMGCSSGSIANVPLEGSSMEHRRHTPISCTLASGWWTSAWG